MPAYSSQNPTDTAEEEVTVRLSPADLESGAQESGERYYKLSTEGSENTQRVLKAVLAAAGAGSLASVSHWSAGGLLGITGLAAAGQELALKLTTAAANSDSNQGTIWLNRGSQAAMVGGAATFVGAVALGVSGQTDACLTLMPLSVVMAHGGATTQHMLGDNPQLNLRLVDLEAGSSAGDAAGKAKRD